MGYTLAGDLRTGEHTGNGDPRFPAAKLAAEEKLFFNGVPLPLQETVKTLGVEVDRELRFDDYVKHIAQKASHRVTTLPRMVGFLDKDCKLLLYNAQIRPRVARRSTRTLLASGDSVEVYSRASRHQSTFVSRVSRMWNIFTAAVPHTQVMNIHSVNNSRRS